MPQVNAAPALDLYLHRSFEVIQFVHDHMDAITAVASHLVPIEDVTEFKADVEALVAKLPVLSEAAELMVTATQPGIDLLIAHDAQAQRLLLELKSAALQDAEYFATAADFAALKTYIDTQLSVTVDTLTQAMELRATHEELAAALVPLDARIATLEADKTLADRIDQILIEIDNGEHQSALTQRVLQLETSIADPVNGLGGLASQQTEMRARVDALEDGLATQAENTTTLTTRVGNLETGQTGNTQAIDSLNVRTTAIEGEIEAQAQQLTQLGATAQDLQAQLDTDADALQSLDVRVSQTENGQQTNAAAITQLDSRVVDAEAQQAINSQAIEALTTSVEQNAQGITIANESLTELQASITGTGNLIPNSAFEFDLRGWTLFSRGNGWLAAQLARDLDAARLPPELHALGLTSAGVPSGDAGIRIASLPVAGGSNYLLSGYLAAENCTLTLEWRLFDGIGNQIGLGIAGTVTDISPALNLADWERQFALIPVATEAALLQVQLWVTAAHVGSPKIWLIRPMLEEAVGAQSAPGPWVPGVNGMEANFAGALEDLTARVTANEDGLEAQSTQVTKLNAHLGNLVEWEVVAVSGSDYTAVGAPSAACLKLPGSAEPAYTFGRGLTIVRFTSDGEFDTATQYDTFSTPSVRTALAAALNAMTPDDGFLVVGNDNHGIKDPVLTAAMEAVGAYQFGTVTGSRPYVLRGRGGIGKGAGIENQPIADRGWLDITLTLVNDKPKGLGDNAGLYGDLAVAATAIQSLDSRVTATEDGLAAVSSAQTAITARVENAEAALVNELITRADKDAVVINAMDDMQGRLVDAETQVAASADTVAGYDTRLTSVEGTVTSQSTAITDLQNTVEDPATGLAATNESLSQLSSKVTADEGTLTAQGDAITALDSRLTSAEGDIAGNASAVDGLSTRVTNAEGQLTAQADQLTTLNSQIADATTNIQANADAVSGLSTRVDDVDGQLTAQSSSITAVSSRVTNVEGVNTSQATAISGLQTSVNSVTGKVNASYTMTLDANGYITGWKFTNDGTTGSLVIRADRFSIVNSSATGARTEYSNGNWRIYDSNNVKRVALGINI